MQIGGIQSGVASAISNLFGIDQDMQATTASIATGDQVSDGGAGDASMPISADSGGLGNNLDISA